MESPKQISLEKILKETGLRRECLEKECSQDNLLGLAKHCDSTTVIGYALGLSKIQISDLGRDNHTSEEKRVGLVLKWKESSAFKATYEGFVEALLACGRNNAATEICRHLAKETKVEPSCDKTDVSTSMVVTEQPIEQPQDTFSPCIDEQGLLKLDTFNDSEERTQPQAKPPSNDTICDLLPETSAPASNDGPGDHPSHEESPVEECSTLRSRINDLEKEYQLIGKKLTDAFEYSTVTLNDLQKHVATLSMSVRRCYEELQKKNELPSQTKHATTMSDFVGVLYDYSNFLNPALLADIVKQFGDEETKSLMKRYNDNLNEFQRTTTLVEFVTECMYEEDLPEGYVEIELVMKSNWEEKTLKDIKPPKRSWLLKKVYFGSLRVVFSIPDLSDLKDEDVHVQGFLRRHVKHILLNGECYLDLESEDRGTRTKDIDFRFSSVTGRDIILSDDGLEAHRRKRFSDDTRVYIATPLSGRFDLELEIKREDGYGSLEIGVAQCTKGSYEHLDIPIRIMFNDICGKMCYWKYDHLNNNLGTLSERYKKYGTVDLCDLQEADTVAMEISESGDLSFYVNGVHQGVAASGLYGGDWDLYPVVGVSGTCVGVKITRAAMSGDKHHAEDQKHRLEIPPSSVGTIQYGFRPETGRNITLLEDGLYARRRYASGWGNSAEVYGYRPLNRRSKFEVKISEYVRDRAGVIQIGVKLLPAARQFYVPSDFESSDNRCMWLSGELFDTLGDRLVCRRYGSLRLWNLRQGDTVGMRVACDGSLTFFVNGQSQGLALKTLLKHRYKAVELRVAYDRTHRYFSNTRKTLKHDVYPVVCVQGKCKAVRITRAESHSEDQVFGLQELCLEKIASCLDWSSKDVNLLPLPPRQKNKLETFIDYL